ncbi:MAG: SMC-Scp complex subunit ScpB [SAR116 cluster bacterium]|nr:SMC-Scp complex subunit ScpB [SAR116 cluster bacterium]|tara:strand:+ start:238 stop:822 length:585 start_codon:yes stop_codon:yes gene_type:complete
MNNKNEIDQNLKSKILEAYIFAAKDPVDLSSLKFIESDNVKLNDLVNELQNKYIDYGINLVKIGNTIAFRTSEEVSGLMNIEQEISKPLSRAASETLAIIAYHQPITRTQIENIRGVSLSKGTLDQLFEIGWIKPGRKLRTPGRPMTWLTTIKFLDHFGLSDLSDLPGLDELKESGLLQHESILFSDPKDEIED